MSSILPVASKTERGEEEDQVRDGQIVDGEVAHLGEVGHHVGVGEHGEDPRGEVGAVVVVAPDADERPNEDEAEGLLRDEKFVQGIGRRQSTAMSRTGESSPPLLSSCRLAFSLVSIYDSLTKFFFLPIPRPRMHRGLRCRLRISRRFGPQFRPLSLTFHSLSLSGVELRRF